MSNEALEAQLQELESQYEQPGILSEVKKEPDNDLQDEELKADEEESLDDEDLDDNPPGFFTLDEWVAAGKDPDLYKGKKAYELEYGRIQENKELQGELKTIRQTMSQVNDSLAEWKTQQTEQIRAQLQDELSQAKESVDFDAYESARDKIERLNATPATEVAQTPQEAPLIADFRRSNPLIDSGSAQFDAAFNEDVELAFNHLMAPYVDESKNFKPGISDPDGKMTRVLNVALKQAKELHADKFTSPRRGRRSVAPKAKNVAPKAKAREQLAQVNIRTSNNRDLSPAQDIADLLQSKYGEEAAENFAKRVIGKQS